MKHVLILAYEFPPHNAIGGHRPYSWFRYLHEAGWYPTIVTRHWDRELTNVGDLMASSSRQDVDIEEHESGRIVRVPYAETLAERLYSKGAMFAFPRRAISLFHEVFDFLLPSGNRLRGLYRESLRQFHETPFDCVIATGSPFILFRHAADLGHKCKVPWVADYRDGWSTNPSLRNADLMTRALTRYYRWVEKRIVSHAEYVTTAAPNYGEAIHKDVIPNARIHTVWNGFDPKMIESLDKDTSETFRVTFAGTLYASHDIERFLQGFRAFLEGKDDPAIELCFLGTGFYPEHAERILGFDRSLNRWLKITDRVPHAEALNAMNASSALLLLASRETQQVHAKVFDYLAVKKPILMFEDDNGPLSEIVCRVYPELICDSAEDVQRNLDKLYQVHKSGRPYPRPVAGEERFSRRAQALEMATVLKQCVADH